MRNEQEVVQRAGQLKASLVARAAKLSELFGVLGAYNAGLTTDIKPERAETMVAQAEKLSNRQAREGLMFAVLRWALGITDGIDDSNLELDK